MKKKHTFTVRTTGVSVTNAYQEYCHTSGKSQSQACIESGISEFTCL